MRTAKIRWALSSAGPVMPRPLHMMKTAASSVSTIRVEGSGRFQSIFRKSRPRQRVRPKAGPMINCGGDGIRFSVRKCANAKMLQRFGELAAGVEEFLRIHRLAVDPCLVMQMRAG